MCVLSHGVPCWLTIHLIDHSICYLILVCISKHEWVPGHEPHLPLSLKIGSFNLMLPFPLTSLKSVANLMELTSRVAHLQQIQVERLTVSVVAFVVTVD